MSTRLAAVVLAVTLAAWPALGEQGVDPLAILSGILADEDQVEVALVALRATKDKDLRPLLEALCRNDKQATRAFGISAMAEIFEADAAGVLRQRLAEDPSKAIRIRAMAGLLGLGALTEQEIELMLSAEDQEVRCLAADAMVRLGRGGAAGDCLGELVASRDLATACSARLNLVAIGQIEHLQTLAETLRDEKTHRKIVLQILSQIAEGKVAAAAGLAEQVANSDRPDSIRLQAYWAIAGAAPRAEEIIGKAILDCDQTVFGVHLLRVLSTCPGSRVGLKKLTRRKDLVGKLARFELVRPAGGTAAEWALKQAIARPHPVVVEYLLDKAAEDVSARGKDAGFYAAPLLEYIRSTRHASSRITAEHYRMAKAATILTDLGTPEAVAGLREILAGPYNTTVRATAAGLLRSKSPAALELARPLLASPYSELSTDAALVLGSFADPAAKEKLEQFATSDPADPTPLRAMSCWYLLKIAGRTKTAAEQLARQMTPAGP